jgi:hypothetical protein
MIERNGQEYLDEADYQTIVDEMARQDTNQESLKYLKDSDWYVTRQAETGKPIPEDVSAKRKTARESIIIGI